MNNMQYKDFIFPHNPAAITLEEPGRHAVHFCPGQGEVVQFLGGGKRSIRCEGSFACATPEEAAALMEGFRARAADPQPGVLFLPGLPPVVAVVTSCVFQAVGTGATLPYAIRFLETGDAQ